MSGSFPIIHIITASRIWTFESIYAGKKKGLSLYPSFLANLLSTLELNAAVICTSLPPLKTFVRHFNLGLLGTVRSSKFSTPGNNNNNSKRPGAHPSTLGSRKRPGQRDEENEIDGSYLELVDGKTDQSHNVTTKDSHSSLAGNSH